MERSTVGALDQAVWIYMGQRSTCLWHAYTIRIACCAISDGALQKIEKYALEHDGHATSM